MCLVQQNDLSPYELERLKRINRNEERLRSLSLFNIIPKKPVSRPYERKKKKAVPKIRKGNPSAPTRSSKRLRNLKEGVKIKEQDLVDDTPSSEEVLIIPEQTVDYDMMPQQPDELDDQEFQIYVSLRAWRLRRKNELEVEPYKICQNKTLCYFIRMRRNDVNFASTSVKSGDAIEEDLLSVWGIGPSKAAEGGFGWEMLEVLNLEDNVKLLELSRKCDKKEVA